MGRDGSQIIPINEKTVSRLATGLVGTMWLLGEAGSCWRQVCSTRGRVLMRITSMIVATACVGLYASHAFAGWTEWVRGDRPLSSPTTRICYLCPSYMVEVQNNGGDGDGTIFARFTSNGGSTWDAWQTLGGSVRNEPTVVSMAPGRIEIFVRGTNNALFVKAFVNGQWSGWVSLGGQIFSSPFAWSSAPGYMSVCAKGGDDRTWCRHWSS